MKKKYAENCRLFMRNTDRLMYEIKTEDFYRDIKDGVLVKFDTSNFPVTSDMPRLNEKVPGMFKDECGGQIIS